MTDPIGTAQERELIETLRSLLSEATARPWVAFDEGNVLALMKGHRPREYSTAKGRKWQEIIAWTGFDAADVPKRYRRANLHLIVAAINSLPAILDALQSRIAEVGRLTEALERAAENFERLCAPHIVGNDVHNFAYKAAEQARAALSLQRRV